LLLSGPAGPGEATGIWLLATAGGPLRKLQDDASGAAASPDGAQIAFFRRAYTEIWLMSPGSEQSRRLAVAKPRYEFAALAWPQDGRRVAYMRRSGRTRSLRSKATTW
jgi:hypothetical protein